MFFFIEMESRQNVRRYQAIENSMEFVLSSLSGHPVQLRTLQESCCVEEISEGSEVTTVSQFKSNNEGKTT